MKKTLILLAMILFTAPAHADTVLETKTSRLKDGLQMKLEKILEDKTGCEYVKISGGIIRNAAPFAAGMIKSLKECDGHKKVYLESTGGKIYGGEGLGRLFKKHNVHTHIENWKFCYSSCALAYLGGRKRTLAPNGAKLWFHISFSAQSGREAHCLPREKKYFRQYIGEMLGFSAESATITEKATSACGYDSWWKVTRDEARGLGIVTHY